MRSLKGSLLFGATMALSVYLGIIVLLFGGIMGFKENVGVNNPMALLNLTKILFFWAGFTPIFILRDIRDGKIKQIN